MDSTQNSDIQVGDTVARKAQDGMIKFGSETAEVLKVQSRNTSSAARIAAKVKWPSALRSSWVLCENLVKVSK